MTFNTVKVPIEYNSMEDKDMIITYQRQQTHIIRSVFKKEEKQEAYNFNSFDYYNDIDLMDSWWKQSAVYEGKAKYDSKEEIEKQEGRDIHVCFGGKQTMNAYRDGLLTKNELWLARLNPLTSIGERNSGTKRIWGNRKFKLSDDMTTVYVKLNDRIIKAKILVKLHENYADLVQAISLHHMTGDIPITYKIDSKYLYISYAVEELCECISKTFQIPDRVFAIDLNPNYIGWSVVQWHNGHTPEIIDTGVISLKDLNDKENVLIKQGIAKSDDRRKKITQERHTEIYPISETLVGIAVHYQCALFSYEKLEIISEDHGKGKYFNRLINSQWLRKPLIDNICKRLALNCIQKIEVKANYSSFIGNFIFRNLFYDVLPDMCLASIEIGRRAYEFYHQYIVKDKETVKNIIIPIVEDFKGLIVKSMEEFGLKDSKIDLKKIYRKLNDSKVTYRVSLDSTNPEF